MILITIATILWLAVGCSSFVYWHTREFDFTVGDIGVAIMASLAGPFSFFLGMAIHGSHDTKLKRVLVKKQ